MAERGGEKVVATGWLMRAAVVDRLGVSATSVRRMEGRLLHPVRGENGTRYFDPAEVESLAIRLAAREEHPEGAKRSNAGEHAARLFPLFERGMSWLDAVVSTRIPPKDVRAMYWEWRQGFHREAPAPDEDDKETGRPDDDEKAFAAWEAEMRALEREQQRFARMSRRLRRR